MVIKRVTKNLVCAIALALSSPLVASTPISATTTHADDTTSRWYNTRPNKAPTGLKKFVVYMANGYVDTNDTDYELPFGMIVLPQAPGMLIGEGFHRYIMCRNDAQIEQHRQEAMQYFDQTFGLTPSDYALSPAPDDLANASLILMPYMVDPRLNFKVYSASGERISRHGTFMRDGGWIAQVIHPNGYTLNSGQVIPPGSTFRYGDYNMRMDRRGEKAFYQQDECSKSIKTLQLKFATREPMIQNAAEPAKILVRDIVSYIDENGDVVIGDGRGSTRPVFTADGQFSLQTRSMISFPPATAP